MEAETLSKVRLRSKDVSDLTMLAMGAFSPLDGFLKKQDYESVVAEMLAREERPPEEFSRKEVIDILVKYYQGGSVK